jgi:hypothetical protein
MAERLIETPRGPARVVTRRARESVADLVLTHGAGGGIDAPDLQAIATALPRHGISVHLVEMPWRVAGTALAPMPPAIDECYLAVLRRMHGRRPRIIGGRSAGARSACRVAGEAGARAVLALSFPLHPPGRPESSRLEELLGSGVPTLVVQGGRDPFGTPEEFPEDVELVPVPEADHSQRVRAKAPISAEEALEIIRESVLEWIVREVTGNRTS